MKEIGKEVGWFGLVEMLFRATVKGLLIVGVMVALVAAFVGMMWVAHIFPIIGTICWWAFGIFVGGFILSIVAGADGLFRP
jgi:hypothetical protein